jgi:hypothetical protein
MTGPWDDPRLEQVRRNQPLAELERKQRKAHRRSYWTVEDFDWAYVEAGEMLKKLNVCPECPSRYVRFAP